MLPSEDIYDELSRAFSVSKYQRDCLSRPFSAKNIILLKKICNCQEPIYKNFKTKRYKANIALKDLKTEPQLTGGGVKARGHEAYFQAHSLTSLFSFTATICLSPRALNNLKARKSDEF